MMKSAILLASAAAAALLAFTPAPIAAQDEASAPPPPVQLRRVPDPPASTAPDFSNVDQDEVMAELEREIEAEFGILGDLFQPEPLTAEQEAILPLATQMTDKIFPPGTFGQVMQETMGPMMGAIMGAVSSDPRIRLAAVTGVDQDDLVDLSDEDAQEVLDIFDPTFAARTDKMGEIMVTMVGRLFDAIEPAYRDGVSRALTTRFTEGEMREALALLETPIGMKLAKESFMVQYDPQMMVIMEQMGPALMQVMPGMMEEFAAVEDEMTEEGRNFGELSAPERARAARLLGKSQQELEALTPEAEAVEFEDDEDVI